MPTRTAAVAMPTVCLIASVILGSLQALRRRLGLTRDDATPCRARQLLPKVLNCREFSATSEMLGHEFLASNHQFY